MQYQNCADAKLSSVYKMTSVGNIAGKFCATLNGSATRYAVKNFFVTNLNAKITGNQLQSDSDADGLSDDFEIASASPAYNKTLRRTFGILDSVCAASGGLSCQYTGLTAAISTGLVETDLAGYSASAGGLGYDADADGIPDFLEILKSTFVVNDDALSDYDLDQKNNLKEVQEGTDVNSSDDQSIPPQHKTSVRYWLSANTGANPCAQGQKLYEFSVDNIPLLPVFAYTAENEEEGYLSHSQNENIILLSYISEPENDGAPREYYTHTVKVNIRDAAKAATTTTPNQFLLQGQY